MYSYSGAEGSLTDKVFLTTPLQRQRLDGAKGQVDKSVPAAEPARLRNQVRISGLNLSVNCLCVARERHIARGVENRHILASDGAILSKRSGSARPEETYR
jgi:hypothetical protein